MITLTQLANYFENGLNETLNNTEIQFKIWADAGEYKKPVREGNVVVYSILGNLQTVASSNSSISIPMGVSELSLDFMIPIELPKTNGTQTEKELAEIKNGQYPFVEYITEAVNTYFGRPHALILPDNGNAWYSVAYQGSGAITGVVGLLPNVGKALQFSVSIEVYFIEGGVNSQNVKLTIDGQAVPYLSVRISRAPVVERDVYSGENKSKCIVSSTAFAIDVDYPCSINSSPTEEGLKYLTEGEPNTVHFVLVEWGQLAKKLYLMTDNISQASSQDISVAGISGSFIEVADNQAYFNVPDAYLVGKFEFSDSINKTLTFTVSADCDTYIPGVGAVSRQSGAQSVTLTDGSFEYDYESDKYYVNFIASKNVAISGSSVPFIVLQEGK